MKKKKKEEKPKVHEELKGFNIEINSFGEIQMTYEMDQLNAFLNEEVDDKKLKHIDKKKKK